jgi:hypothetical protein
MTMGRLWIVLCEVSAVLESRKTFAFTNVVTWGERPEDALERVRICFTEYKWELIGCDKISPVEEDSDYGDLNDLIERAANNPAAVLYSTFHTYKPN